jgi:hypothetical protein
VDLQPWRRKIQGEGEEETILFSEEYDHTKGRSKNR